MNFANYELEASNNDTVYSFSDTVSGIEYNYRIIYAPIPNNPTIYNLGFGLIDLNDQLDDEAEPNINNLAKVIKTVGLTIYEFTNAYPERSVYFSGNTKQKQFLYDRVIRNNYELLSKTFKIYGQDHTSQFVEYKPNATYLAFILIKTN